MASDSNIKLLVIVHKKYNRSLPTKYFNFVPLVYSFAYPNLHIGQNLRFSLDKITGPNRTRKNMYTIAILTYGSSTKIPNFMIFKDLKQVTQHCFSICAFQFALQSLSNTPHDNPSICLNIYCLTGPFCSSRSDVLNLKTEILWECKFEMWNSNALSFNVKFSVLYLSEFVE
jgi:hypothetical protein